MNSFSQVGNKFLQMINIFKVRLDISSVKIYFYAHILIVLRGSSMAEHAAVNRRVVGSSPTRGAKIPTIGISSF